MRGIIRYGRAGRGEDGHVNTSQEEGYFFRGSGHRDGGTRMDGWTDGQWLTFPFLFTFSLLGRLDAYTRAPWNILHVCLAMRDEGTAMSDDIGGCTIRYK